MAIDLTGRVALITGAGTGLGRAYALLFASLGAKIVVNDLGASLDGHGVSHSAADAVVQEIRDSGGEAIASYDSVSDPEGAARMVAAAIARFGRLDIVVNNAGILRDKSFAKMTAADFEDVVKVHLFGGFYVTHAAWPHLVEQKYGRVIFTTSAAGTNGNFGQSNYAAAKLGLVGMMNCLAIEGQRYDIRVNAISPGAITRMSENIPVGDFGPYMRADLVAPAVAWLASDACDKTGTILSSFAGYYAALKYFEGKGVQFDPVEPVTPAMIAEQRGAIFDLGAAQPVAPGPLNGIEDRLRAIGRL